MTETKIGWRVYGLGVIGMALISLALGSFDPTQPVPKELPYRTVLAYAAALLILAAGISVEWRRTAARGGAALAIYFAVVAAIVLNGRVLLAHYSEFGAYSGAAEPLAIAAGGLVIYAAFGRIDPARAMRLTRLGQVGFAVCALLFGAAHFFYMNLTIPLVPAWLPPTQEFWAYATGVAHIAAGIAILTGVQARLAAILLTVMYASFTPLVHLPLLFHDSASHFYWTENTLNIALTGVAWVIADSLPRHKRARH